MLEPLRRRHLRPIRTIRRVHGVVDLRMQLVRGSPSTLGTLELTIEPTIQLIINHHSSKWLGHQSHVVLGVTVRDRDYCGVGCLHVCTISETESREKSLCAQSRTRPFQCTQFYFLAMGTRGDKGEARTLDVELVMKTNGRELGAHRRHGEIIARGSHV